MCALCARWTDGKDNILLGKVNGFSLSEPYHFVKGGLQEVLQTIKKKRVLSEPALNNNDCSSLVQMRFSRELWENKVVMVTDNIFFLLEVRIVKELSKTVVP